MNRGKTTLTSNNRFCCPMGSHGLLNHGRKIGIGSHYIAFDPQSSARQIQRNGLDHAIAFNGHRIPDSGRS